MGKDLQTADPLVNVKEDKDMISKPKANCPRCGSRYTVYDATWVGPHAETVSTTPNATAAPPTSPSAEDRS